MTHASIAVASLPDRCGLTCAEVQEGPPGHRAEQDVLQQGGGSSGTVGRAAVESSGLDSVLARAALFCCIATVSCAPGVIASWAALLTSRPQEGRLQLKLLYLLAAGRAVPREEPNVSKI